MSMSRIDWEHLPEQVRHAVEAHTGPFLKAETVSGGKNSQIAACVFTAEQRLFVKGMPSDHPQHPSQQREAAINPYVAPRLAPTILWRVQDGGWDLLAFEYVSGRHADYAPGSPDLPRVLRLAGELAQVDTPPAQVVRTVEQRWSAHADPGAAERWRGGQALLHTDFASHNVLLGETRDWLIDWAWPTIGPAWVDPVVLILRLMEAGHTAAQADAECRALPAWQGADREDVASFSAANARLWKSITEHDPEPWKQHMARLAGEWCDYWAGLS
ncbi:phosphotransferase family protein [Streptomyces sp. NBC_01602]|uniref:phosphotransferase family protein n=1 Tax=Streptomyces sp. NBC_01602 TaxID=2975893 RepID=UPI0038649F06|nr:aminoglycoside phosphotransferase family protein [Streptomyces sp. NBC_01602]